MIFDINGYPRANGVTDFADSAVLAGMLAVFGAYPMAQDSSMTRSKLSRYSNKGICVRYPFVDVNNASSNNPLNVTRDQIVVLAAGYAAFKWQSKAKEILEQTKRRSTFGIKRAQNVEADIVGSAKPWYNGADIMTPADMGHLRKCAGEVPSLLQRLWLRCEILVHNTFTPMREPNQLMCKAKIAGPAYVELVKRNDKWRDAVRLYWNDSTSTSRGEAALAEFFIANF